MKKETIFAIFLGIAAGVGVAFFVVLKARETQIQKAKPISTINLTPSVTVQNNQQKNLEVTSPQNGFVTTDDTVDIKGKGAKNSLLVVQSPIKNYVVQMKSDTFTVSAFPITQGENIIRLTIYPKDPQFVSQELELRIYHIDQ